jgi:hypothetical protein
MNFGLPKKIGFVPEVTIFRNANYFIFADVIFKFGGLHNRPESEKIKNFLLINE